MEAGIADKDGVLLTDAIRQAGLADAPRLTPEPGRYLGFLEAHIEQGPRLEDAGDLIGVVTDIVGLRGYVVTFSGQQNHAGTTMMDIRKDAAAALFAFGNRINTRFPKAMGRRSVWTMGRVVVSPGAPSIVPGHAELSLQFRDASETVLADFAQLVDEIEVEVNALGGARVTVTPARAPVAPTVMDANLRGHIARAAETHAPGKWVELESAAFHDAGVVSAVLPSAMLFIPSIGGISHDFAEDSHDSDIVLGCQVLADAAAGILAQAREGA